MKMFAEMIVAVIIGCIVVPCCWAFGRREPRWFKQWVQSIERRYDLDDYHA